jgi:hypothetical protein
MGNSNENTGKTMSFQERYSGYSDNHIMEILKNHKDYKESAVSAAVQIAIERQLIHSEQDLIAPEFQSVTPSGVKLFPVISNPYHYKKTVASIFRVLFMVGLIPLIFGIMKYAEGKINMTIPALVVSLGWMLLSFLLLRTKRILILIIQFIILIFTISSIAYYLIIQEVFPKIDMVMLAIGSLITIYLILYLKKLIQTKPDDL